MNTSRLFDILVSSLLF